MTPEIFDIVLRTVTVLSAVFLAVLLAANSRGKPAAVPGAWFCLATSAFFITSAAGAAMVLGFWGYLLTALCVTKAVWFWLFARSWFNEKLKPSRGHFVVAGLVAIVGTWQQKVFLPQFRAGEAELWINVLGFGFEVILGVFVLMGLGQAWRDLGVDLVERRRRFRVRFMTVAAGFLVATLFVQSFNLVMDVSTPAVATYLNMMLVSTLCVLGAGFLLRFREESWIDPGQCPPDVVFSAAEQSVLYKLERAVDGERIFLQEGLTIGALADHIGTGEHVLRKVINRGLGYRNFNDYLHSLRIREACTHLARPEQARQPVLSIALNAGYGSIGAFNRAFKVRTGMTPTEYRRQRITRATNAP